MIVYTKTKIWYFVGTVLGAILLLAAPQLEGTSWLLYVYVAIVVMVFILVMAMLAQLSDSKKLAAILAMHQACQPKAAIDEYTILLQKSRRPYVQKFLNTNMIGFLVTGGYLQQAEEIANRNLRLDLKLKRDREYQILLYINLATSKILAEDIGAAQSYIDELARLLQTPEAKTTAQWKPYINVLLELRYMLQILQRNTEG